ncbi:peptidase S8/S53 subtilisin kexin sedolisin [Gammaproteobacteria bacterium LSUCC0057]|uniref:Peptidase S8/S53 subtilisin kexin sedolisin n=1 Tax=Gammaproteobacteria bacterium LSUCC0057 TaxID=2559237 RepID=A0A4Y8ULR8_9GAMM|nr:peptidase S8/S53 subtilisin kexin sedolisin [Gammaproteobacteria bacterium LSUCC0057]
MAGNLSVGLVDSALSAAASAPFASYQRQLFNPSCAEPAQASDSQHGSAVCASWAPVAARVELYNAVIFNRTLRCQQQQLVAALDWLAHCQVRVVHLSLGLRQPSAALAAACERLTARGTLLIASAPAQGEAVYPASFSGVISASGDARCQPGEISQLNRDNRNGPQFGGAVYSPDHPLRGASIGAGAVTAALLALQLEAAAPLSYQAALAQLADRADYHGREQRRQPCEPLHE